MKSKFKTGMSLCFLSILIEGIVSVVISQSFIKNELIFLGSIALIIFSFIGLILTIFDKLPVLEKEPSPKNHLVLMIMWYFIAITNTVGLILYPFIPLHSILPLPWTLGVFYSYFFYINKYTKSS